MPLKRPPDGDLDVPRASKRIKIATSEQDFLPATLPKALFLHVVDLLEAQQQQGTLASLAGVNRLCHRIVMPKLYHHVRLPNTRSVTRFFNHFHVLPPTQMEGHHTADDQSLIDHPLRTLARKTLLPTMIRHLDIEFSTIDLDVGPLTRFLKNPSDTASGMPDAPLFPSLESLHVKTIGPITLKDIEESSKDGGRTGKAVATPTTEQKEPFQQSNSVRLLAHVFKYSAAVHVRWIPFEDSETFALFEEIDEPEPLRLSHIVRVKLGRLFEQTPAGRARLQTYDMPVMLSTLVGKARRVFRALGESASIGHALAWGRSLLHIAPSLSEWAEQWDKKSAMEGGSIIISGIELASERASVEECLRDWFPQELKVRYSIVGQDLFKFDSADGWRQWLRRDDWDAELKYL